MTTEKIETDAPPLDKDPFDISKVRDEQPYDAVVIGSGVGGLTAASFLAQEGRKVLVLEQHQTAGGCCHTFELGGYRFGTGVHYVGNLEEGKRLNLRVLLDSVTAEGDPIVWDKMDDNFETFVFGDSRYENVAGIENLKQVLLEKFPEEKEAIEKYLDMANASLPAARRATLFKTLPLNVTRALVWTGLHRWFDKGFHKYTNITAQQGLEKLTSNADLQAVFAGNYGDYGVEPARAPLLLPPAVTKHFSDGAYYPNGGPSAISQKILKNIVQNGGQVLVSAPVERILVESTSGNKGKVRVTGVQTQGGDTIRAKTVVSDCGFFQTATKLLPPDTIKAEFGVDERSDKLHPSTAGINLFVGLQGDSEALNLPRSIYWIYPSNDLNADADKMRNITLDEALQLEPNEIGPIFVSCPSTKDKAWKESYPNKSALEIICPAPWSWFEKFHGMHDESFPLSLQEEYESSKKILAEKVWKRVVQVLESTGAKLPKTLDQVDQFNVATPLTFGHMLGRERGAFYGLDNDMKRFEPKTYFLRLRPQVPEVLGLYLTGQDVILDGIDACVKSGWMAAGQVLGKRNPLSLLRKQKPSTSTKKVRPAEEDKLQDK